MSQRVLVAGAGLSGISAAKLLLDMGGEVVLYDSNPDLDPEALKQNFEESRKVSVVLGDLKRTDLVGVEMCVISPGISLESPFVAVLDNAKIPIWSEIQLAYQCAKGKLAAITGTNGKTTTTALTGQILKAFYEDVHVVGNIGIPYTQVAGDDHGLPSGYQRYLKHYTRSLKPSSHHGVLYCHQGKHCHEPDGKGCMCVKL